MIDHKTQSATAYNVGNTNTYKVIVNINLNKLYIIKKYSAKRPEFIQKKVREISVNKGKWSDKVIARIAQIINNKQYRIDPNIFITAYNISNEVVDIEKDHLPDLIAERERHMATAKEILNTNLSNQMQEVYIKNTTPSITMNDEQLAFTILLLSQLAKESPELWVSPIIMLKQIIGAIFYFIPEQGQVVLSRRSFMNKGMEENTNSLVNLKNIANQYVENMNNLITGKVKIPYYQSPV